MRFTTLILLSTCLTVLFLVPFAYAQETLKPNQLVTFSLAPGQEKLFVLQMKKGDFAEILLAGEQEFVRLNLSSFEIYDSARKELLDKSYEGDQSLSFVAPRDGDFLLVSKLGQEYDGARKITFRYNNKFELPPGAKLKDIRKVNGYDVKIMTIDDSFASVLLIEKNGQLQKVWKANDLSHFFLGGDTGDDSAEIEREIRTTRDKAVKIELTKELKSIQLINTTPDKTGNGIPDVMIYNLVCGASGRYCSTNTYFIDLGDTVKISESIGAAVNSGGLSPIGKNPKGGLRFEVSHEVYFGSALVILEFRNGKLRPNFDLMKKPAPSLAVLRTKAKKFRNQLSLKPYKGVDNEDSGLFAKEDLGDETPFWDVMVDLIYTGNEDLAWQFLDLVWHPQKQGKEIFIRDFKKQLLESEYWQMILEDRNK